MRGRGGGTFRGGRGRAFGGLGGLVGGILFRSLFPGRLFRSGGFGFGAGGGRSTGLLLRGLLFLGSGLFFGHG